MTIQKDTEQNEPKYFHRFVDFAGKRVEVSGEPPKRLKIVGGLYPSPNTAAQGGHDHVKESMAAATPANTPGGSALPEFRVRSVRVVTGACSD